MGRISAAALRAPLLVAAVACLLAAAGLRAYAVLDIEAYPNPVAPMIEIIAQPQGLAAEEVERTVTIPLENALAGMPDLVHIRSQSLFGLSDVKCYFSWAPPYAEAQQRVLNRLQTVQLPPGVQPQLSPWSAVGEIYRYVLRGKGYSLTDLRVAQDWILEKAFRQVPGVVDVTGYGGEALQYQVDVDPIRLRGHNATLQQLTQALAQSNQDAGGQRLTLGEQSYDVRALGLLRTVSDVEEVPLSATRGTPVLVRDVATVHAGAAPRLGIVGKDLEADVVQGVVLLRYGGNALETLEKLHAKVDDIRKHHLLPPGMDLEPYYDRGTLTKLTTHTVVENLLVGMALVALMLWLFLGDGRAALIAALNVPLALLAAFAGMVLTRTPANLISLGAVDFGIIVESTVIVVENIHRHLAGARRGDGRDGVLRAVSEVGGPMMFSTLVIVVAFLPLFTMTGVSGVIFSPLARTYAFAIGAAVVLSVTLTPVLAARFLKGHAGPDRIGGDDPFLVRKLRRLYAPLFRFAVQKPALAVAVAAAPIVVALACAPLLGGEFMPKLEEGNFWIRGTLPMSASLEQSGKYVGRMRRILLGCPPDEATACTQRTRPEILTVISQVGRPDDGTDPSGFNSIELFAPLRPSSEWRKGVTKEALTRELSAELTQAFPGITFSFSQYIADNVEEAMSGVKGENTVKVVGPDLVVNEEKAKEIEAALAGVPGIADLGREEVLGQPDVRITPDRAACRRYGLNVGDVEAVVQAAVGGATVTQLYQGEKHFDVVVRWAKGFRSDLRSLREILVPTPEGAQIPLGQLARIETVTGPARVFREDASRFAPVRFSVRGRDLASAIADAQARVASKVRLPWDTHLEWGGEMNELKEALDRLLIVLPLTLLFIAFLVYSAVGTLRDTGVVLAGIPAAVSGGVLALLLTRTTLSISPAMGFVSLLGIAVQDALLVVDATRRMWRAGHGLQEGARLGAERGLRPVLMTASVALIGLLPAAVSRGIGSETQRPLAIVVIGGALVLSLLPRLLLPALLVLAHRRDTAEELAGPSAAQDREAAPELSVG